MCGIHCECYTRPHTKGVYYQPRKIMNTGIYRIFVQQVNIALCIIIKFICTANTIVVFENVNSTYIYSRNLVLKSPWFVEKK